MNRREFMQAYYLTVRQWSPPETATHFQDPKYRQQIIDMANKVYDEIERDEKVAADNSMPDTRNYLETVGANGHG